LGQGGKRSLQRFHSCQAQAETLEAGVDRAVSGRGERDERTTLCAAVIKTGQHGFRVEPKPRKLGFDGGGTAVGSAGQALDESQLASFDLGQGCGFGNVLAYFLDRFGSFSRTVGNGFAGLRVFGQVANVRLGNLVDEILATLQVLGDLADVVAIGFEPRFGFGHGRFTMEQ
jgi:hypothetical protein